MKNKTAHWHPSEEPTAVAVPVGPESNDLSAPLLDGAAANHEHDPNHDHDDDPSDAAAKAAAAEARDLGTALIRDHLRAHLSQNPRSSFVTWVATLHPENATVAIDPRFFVPGNPWLTVYEQVKRDLRDGAVPATVVAEPVGPDVGADPSGPEPSGPDPGAAPPRKCYGGCPDLVVGLMFLLGGVFTALGIEALAVFAYLGEVLFSRIASACSPRCSPVALISALPFAMSRLLAGFFRLADVLLLLSSVSAVELIAATGALVCAVLALSCAVGREAHQRTRRSAHLTRWACRHCFESWTPPRATLGLADSVDRGGHPTDGSDEG